MAQQTKPRPVFTSTLLGIRGVSQDVKIDFLVTRYNPVDFGEHLVLRGDSALIVDIESLNRMKPNATPQPLNNTRDYLKVIHYSTGFETEFLKESRCYSA